MHVLKKNNRLNIDNEKITFKEIIAKLKEEFYDVIRAINKYSNDKILSNLEEVIRETFDIIQIAILILWRCHRQAVELDKDDLIREINFKHKDKLSEMGWTFETGIEIDVKE